MKPDTLMHTAKRAQGRVMGWIVSAVLIGCTGGLVCAGAFAQEGRAPGASDDERVETLLRHMTLEEEIGQMTLYACRDDITSPSLGADELEAVRRGRCGNLFNAHTVAYTRELQKIAVEETRLGIPLLFGYDVIHGHKTIFGDGAGARVSGQRPVRRVDPSRVSEALRRIWRCPGRT